MSEKSNNNTDTGHTDDLGKPRGEEFCPVCRVAIGTCPECLSATVTADEICRRTRVRRQSVYAKSERRRFPVRKKKPEYIPAHGEYTDDEVNLMQRAVDSGFSVSDARSAILFHDSGFTIEDCKKITRIADTGFMLYEKGRGGGKAYRVWTAEEARILEHNDGRRRRK